MTRVMRVWKRSVELSRYAVGGAMEIEGRGGAPTLPVGWTARPGIRGTERSTARPGVDGAGMAVRKLAYAQASATPPLRRGRFQAATRRARP
jgi:hypothetical protein